MLDYPRPTVVVYKTGQKYLTTNIMIVVNTTVTNVPSTTNIDTIAYLQKTTSYTRFYVKNVIKLSVIFRIRNNFHVLVRHCNRGPMRYAMVSMLVVLGTLVTVVFTTIVMLVVRYFCPVLYTTTVGLG
jgi:nitrogen fixation/metabolism regulation signal transduction histidine kinase